MSTKRRNVTNVTNLQPLEGSFQTFRKYLCLDVRFAAVSLGQIHNLDLRKATAEARAPLVLA